MSSLAHAVGVSVSPYSVSGIRSLELLIFSDFLCISGEALKIGADLSLSFIKS